MKILTTEQAKDWVANGYASDVNIYEITHLAPGAAAILATKNEDLNLDQLKELDDDSAMALSIHKKGELSLRYLRKLSEKASLALARHPGKLNLYHLATTPKGKEAIKGHSCFNVDECNDWFISSCTQEMALRFTEDPENANLDDFQCFAPGAAKIYATAKCDTLNLQCLEMLDPEDASGLANFPGDILLGQQLPFLSSDTMKELGKHTGGMRLGIESISNQALEHFRNSGDLELGSLRELDAKDAEPLRNRKGRLSFGSLNEIDEDSAKILATVQGDLDLEYLFRIPMAAFQALSTHKGTMRLGIHTLNSEEAERIVKHQGTLELPKLKFLLPDAAMHLSGFREKLTLGSVTMPLAAVDFLKNHSDFNDEWVCNHVLDKEIAAAPQVFDFTMRLLGEDAELVLMKKQEKEEYKNLDLESILAISDQAAENIAKFRGTINFGVYELTDSSATALSKHRGTLVLTFLHKISTEGAKALSRHKDLQVVEHYLSPELYKIITKAESLSGSSPEAEENVDDSDSNNGDDEKTPEKLTQSIHFNLGRFRARYDAAGSRMGSFKDLLDEVEDAVKAGADLSFLKTEQLIVDFLASCQKGEDTSEIRKKIDDSSWED